MLNFGVLTISDSCFSGTNKDVSGPKIVELIKSKFPKSSILVTKIVPDEVPIIKEVLVEWCTMCDVIFTTGGTGFFHRDVTPEATRDVITREAPGVVIAMMVKGLSTTPYAMLSRAVCGIRDNTFIINFPGSAKAVSECFEAICEVIPHAMSLIKGDNVSAKASHSNVQSSPSKVKCNPAARRARHSKYPMIEVKKAVEIILSITSQEYGVEMLSINDSLGRVLAEDIRSYEPLPPFPASIKDGYAVKSSDDLVERKVREDVVAAGDSPSVKPLQPGECIRISTGAPIPPGADAVVQIEDTLLTHLSKDGEEEVAILLKNLPNKGQDIRPVGSDIESHVIVVRKNTRINAGITGVMATVGHTKVKVYKPPTIGVISSGEELQSPHEALKPGRIRDSNKTALVNLFKQYGYVAGDFGIARDNPNSIKQVIEHAFKSCDIVITTGGVSMGEFDLIKEVLQHDFDAQILFGRVNMKPGKPTTFATCVYNGKVKLFFGLPGNPVSAMVTCILFVVPCLRFSENDTNYKNTEIFVNVSNVKLDRDRPEYQRAVYEYRDGSHLPYAVPTGNQISSRINSFVDANCLLKLPSEREHRQEFFNGAVPALLLYR